VCSGTRGDKSRIFDDRDDAGTFAEGQTGRPGMVVDTALMTPEQFAAHKVREARAQQLIREIDEMDKQEEA
jgi:hypothetical protein